MPSGKLIAPLFDTLKTMCFHQVVPYKYIKIIQIINIDCSKWNFVAKKFKNTIKLKGKFIRPVEPGHEYKLLTPWTHQGWMNLDYPTTGSGRWG